MLAGVGVLAVSWPWLLPAVTSYLAAGLDDCDKYSSVYALPVGIACVVLLSIYERVLGAKHPETQVVREALAYWSP